MTFLAKRLAVLDADLSGLIMAVVNFDALAARLPLVKLTAIRLMTFPYYHATALHASVVVAFKNLATDFVYSLSVLHWNDDRFRR